MSDQPTTNEMRAGTERHGEYNGWCRSHGIPVKWDECPSCLLRWAADRIDQQDAMLDKYAELEAAVRTSRVYPGLGVDLILADLGEMNRAPLAGGSS